MDDALFAAACLAVALGVTQVAVGRTWWSVVWGIGWLFIALGCWRQRDELLRNRHK